jgi:polyisoprenoid-binding protein YceI
MRTFKLLVLAAALAFSPACKKKDEAKKETPPTGSAAAPTPPPPGPDQTATPTPTPPPPTPTPAPPTPAPPAEDTADSIKVMATHFTKKDTDPVEVNFEKFKVVKANFDAKKIEGGTATIEIDLTSLKTNEAKRDQHLQTPDYLDTKKFATATVEVSNVKKKGDDKHYTADAKVKLHGVEKKLPVEFEVVDAKDDWIRIKGEAPLKRLDFKVGKKAGADMKKDDGVAEDMTVKIQLTLKKT